jgi:UDP-N-acetylglucosamine diphosphorylase / glucose-1-phosphate thymidylyltransferase / UDP-N-acetylgalactosamine diphosphorylase / glucosamine-1-phosphate N-acetyltransferase / galactosamine-1-phosphate N-acetyltransferase
MLQASDLFEVPESLPFASTFRAELAPWEWLSLIKQALAASEFTLPKAERPCGLQIRGDVYIHPSVKLPPFGSILGPAYISEGCDLRPGVYVRGNVIAGRGCVLGNSCEFKNCLLLDGVQVPHFSYVGDSILGNGVHLGAGVICSNLRLDQSPVAVMLPDGTKQSTGLRKLGALIGDRAEVGCNAVLNPGSILGKRALIMPALAFRGSLGENSIAYQKAPILTAPRMD